MVNSFFIKLHLKIDKSIPKKKWIFIDIFSSIAFFNNNNNNKKTDTRK
jgi:hypothetical protein